MSLVSPVLHLAETDFHRTSPFFGHPATEGHPKDLHSRPSVASQTACEWAANCRTSLDNTGNRDRMRKSRKHAIRRQAEPPTPEIAKAADESMLWHNTAVVQVGTQRP
jgi:hypothetical protein